MRLNKSLSLAVLGFSLGLVGAAQAHTPLCACYDNGDGTVLCEGGFSDGSSASGVRMAVKDADGNILIDAKMDENSEFTFDMPEGEYSVLFDGGEGHRITVPAEEIF